ncbi:MAG: SGNH/GDSL hydrolase family protein [Micromonosporaceae bacterium]|nr:SGNH/GDSL hydrolase family protein [Micromonosporaceae bacterium]
MSPRAAFRFLAAAILLAFVATLGPAMAASARPEPDAALDIQRYVALGDSYTSGPFIPFLRLDPIGCGRSTNNYPSLLSQSLGLDDYTDVSCGGAATRHMTEPQAIPLGTNEPQFDALRADTDLVTVGIGGNDFGTFGNLVGVCPTLRESDPTGSPCREHFTVDGVDTVRANMTAIRDNVTAVLRGVRQRSPQAAVVIVGYPRIVPPKGTCPDVIPFADGDYRWADQIEQALNRAIRQAAKRTGAVYVDTYTPSLGHDACAGDEAWINGKDTDVLRAASYHPFVSYMAAAASLIHDTLRGVAPSPERAAAAARAAQRELEKQLRDSDSAAAQDAERAGELDSGLLPAPAG